MRVIQYLAHSYHVYSWGLEKIAQTLSDWLNEESDIEVQNFASDIKKWSWWTLDQYTDTVFIPSFDVVYNFPLPKFWTKRFCNHFKNIKTYNPDVIMTHTRFFVQSMVWGLIAKRLWCKRVHIEHGSGFVTWYPRYIKVCAWIFDWTIGLWIFRQCDQIITISQMHKQFISKFTSKTPTVIYNPIDYQAQEKVRNNIPHIGFVGRLVSLKWVDLLIQALKRIEEQSRSCTIVWTGDQDHQLKQLAHDLWLFGRIDFVWTDDRVNRLHKFDIFVNPSYQEWVPTTVVEALLAKCIVVATDVWWTCEISNQQDLILCRLGDIDDLKDKLAVAFTRMDQGWMSYGRIVQQFWHKIAITQYKITIQSIIDQK